MANFHVFKIDFDAKHPSFEGKPHTKLSIFDSAVSTRSTVRNKTLKKDYLGEDQNGIQPLVETVLSENWKHM